MLWAGVAAVSLAIAGFSSGDMATHASTAFMVAATVGTDGWCSPRHQTRSEPSCLADGIL